MQLLLKIVMSLRGACGMVETSDILCGLFPQLLSIIFQARCLYSEMVRCVKHARVIVCVQYREERFRETSESTNQRVLWWAIAQTAILVITGMWQMKHLKSFFEAKKLV